MRAGVALLHLHRGRDRQQANRAVGVHHGAAVGDALRDHLVEAAADALDQIVVGVVLLEVAVDLPLLLHVHLGEAEILHIDEVGFVEMGVVIGDPAQAARPLP